MIDEQINAQNLTSAWSLRDIIRPSVGIAAGFHCTNGSRFIQSWTRITSRKMACRASGAWNIITSGWVQHWPWPWIDRIAPASKRI